MYSLKAVDFVKGVITAVFAGVVLAILAVMHGVVTADNFDVFSIDWGMLIHNMINTAIIGAEGGFAGYISKNFFTDKNGAFLGRFGGTK